MSERTNELGLPIGPPVADWKGATPPPHTDMDGRYCRLEPLDAKAHVQDLYNAYVLDSEDRDWTYLFVGPYKDFGDFKNWVLTVSASTDQQFYAIVDLPTGRAAGVASYLRIAPSAGSIEVGSIHYGPTLQRSRTATESMYLMMARVFDELGYRRYEWKCDSLNARSCQAALRLGMTFEGIFRQCVVYKGRNRDTAWYSILDHEWPTTKAGYQAWLSADNFDADENQRDTLSDLIKQHRA